MSFLTFLPKLKIREFPIAAHYETFQLIFRAKLYLNVWFTLSVELANWNINYAAFNPIPATISRNPAAYVATFLAQFAGHIVTGN